MSKVKMLVDAGLLEDQGMTDEEKQVIESEISDEELETIIRVGKRVSAHPKVASKKVGCAL